MWFEHGNKTESLEPSQKVCECFGHTTKFKVHFLSEVGQELYYLPDSVS